MASDPQTSWFNAAIATATSLWQAFIVPAALGTFAFYKFRTNRKDQRDSRTVIGEQDGRRISMTYEQQLQEALLKAGAAEKENIRWLVEEQKKILLQKDEDLEEARQKKDYWQQLATYCYIRWVETTGDLRQARTLALIKGRRLKEAGLLKEEDIQTWAAIPPIPNLEEIVPRHGEDRRDKK